MHGLETSFLRACEELVLVQQELVPLLADTLGVPPQELFYGWMKGAFSNVHERELDRESGRVSGTEWHYCFHGFECDFWHNHDPRYVRVEFGPHGRFNAFTPWSVLQFVMTSCLPWPDFRELQECLAEKPPPYNHLSGSQVRANELWDMLEARGLVQLADPTLQRLVESRTILRGRTQVIELPENFSWQERLDCLVCARGVLSTSGSEPLG